jgi:hypothetical protein
MYMEMSQKSSLCSYLKHTKKNDIFFFLLQNQRTGGQTGPAWGVGTSGRGRGGRGREGEYGTNTVYTCM